MLLNLFKSKQHDTAIATTYIEEKLQAIRVGNDSVKEEFIERFTPFIIKTTSKVINSYVDLNCCDEYSIALIAFNEAIDTYSIKRGNFIKYSELVIRNRIIDYKRKNNREQLHTTPVDLHTYSETNQEMIASKEDFTARLDAKDQIQILKDKLSIYNITLSELVDISPKHAKTKRRAIGIAHYICESPMIKDNFYRTKRLPMKRLSHEFDISTRTLKRLKKYIITIVLVIDSDLDILKNHLSTVEGGLSNDV